MAQCKKPPRSSLQFPPLRALLLPQASQFSIALKSRLDHHQQNLKRWNFVASKRDAQQLMFVESQKKYYEGLGGSSVQRKAQPQSTSSDNVKHKQIMKKIVEHSRNDEKKRLEHFRQVQEKGEKAEIRKTHCLTNRNKRMRRQSSNLSSITIRTQQSHEELEFSKSVHKKILQKQSRASRNLSELSERKKEKSAGKAVRMSVVYQKKTENYEDFQKKSLRKLVNDISKSQVLLEKLETLEKDLIDNRTKRQNQSQHKARDARQKSLKQRQQKVLKQQKQQNLKIEQAERRRQALRKCTSLETSKHIVEVLKKNKNMKQKQNQYFIEKTVRKIAKYKEIDTFRAVSERMRQSILTGKYINRA